MNTLTPLFNRENQLPTDGWFHLVPRGEYPHTDDGKIRIQVIDDASLDAMMNSFAPKLLIDQEHFSHQPDKSSEAMGWITAIQKRADGIWGQVEWTDLGDAAVKNRRYRFLSPTWRKLQPLGGNKVRPLHLLDVGLTNQPNICGMVPLTNRQGADAQEEFRRTDAADSNHNKNQAPMKNIAALLGLTAEASEDSILAAVNSLKNRATGAETKATEIAVERDELKNRVTIQDDEQIEQEFDARDVEEGKRTKLKPVLAAMKNRTERVEFLNEVIGEPGETEAAITTPSGKPVLNRNGSGTPKPGKGGAGSDPQELANKAESAVQDYRLANRCTYTEAHTAVMRKSPELFGVAVK